MAEEYSSKINLWSDEGETDWRGKKTSRDQGVNTEKTMMTNINENEQNHKSLQSESGLLYAGNRKRKATSPPGMRAPPEEKKDNVVDI